MLINPHEFKSMKECRRHGDELLPITQYCIRQEDALSVLDCHWHSEMEFFRVMQGVFSIQCGSNFYEAHEGDIAFFNSGELHAAATAGNTTDLLFQAVVFSPDLFCSATNDILRIKYITPVVKGEIQLPRLIRKGTELHEKIAPLFDAVCYLLDERPFLFEFELKAAMLHMFALVVDGASTADIPARPSAAAANIKKVIQYIQANYRTPLTIDKLAETAGMSEGHFCRVFKQYTLKTPVQFVNGVRLTHAADQLTNTNKRVLDIAMDCGFNSVSYFIEVFRESFGITPSKYRKG